MAQHINGTKLELLLQDALLNKVEEFQSRHKLPSRVEALRKLIALGLEYAPQHEELRAYAKGARRPPFIVEPRRSLGHGQ
jgi:metal-responsive CopG/Arc/MetJ family transcriptional regulator